MVPRFEKPERVEFGRNKVSNVLGDESGRPFSRFSTQEDALSVRREEGSFDRTLKRKRMMGG